ncbi:hypothetical protein Tco_0031081 [Tanacetum coccineum]
MTNPVSAPPTDPPNTRDGSSIRGFARFNTIITSLKALDEGFSSKNYVRKFLRALHPKWRAKVTTIKESKDLSSLALDELIGNLKVHEVVMEKDSKIYRGKKERIKSITLKAKKESSDDETSTSGSDDEKYDMPFELGTTRDTLGTTPEGGVLLRPERPHTYEDLSDTEKKRYDADVCATNIALQGLPKDIYKLINHNIEAKAIWDNVKILLAGSELTKEDKESQLYDEFERFKMLPSKNINEYYVCFYKLVNDMRNIRMTMPNIQLNSKL